MRFEYICEKCGYQTVDTHPNLETCPVPVYGDGEPVIIPPKWTGGPIDYTPFAKCGGEFDGARVWWDDIPEHLQDAIIAAEQERP
ncbi:MAG: hypothetical protein OEW46_12890, partial [Actinomycetota bacterium]|nr:hypothetical protein [Actinomycetota bacterium]